MDSLRTFLNRFSGNSDVVLAVGALALLGIMVVPLPPLAMDVLLAASFALAILVFLTTLGVRRALELSVFPTLLLGTTVFRLSLNVASTRLILLEGANGEAAAGRIIEAFGQFVVGGNYAVGLVVFVILIIINFVVITKGAGRVAEVSARFTLDAMPGKQMAIDAELNAGLIDEKQARSRRAEVAREADFFGSMDGASKFIKGDAIAGIVITLVNVLGGIFIGMVQHGLPLTEALERYTLLTIGDGLVGQIPALIISAAAGLLVTRVPDAEVGRLDDQLSNQLFSSPRTMIVLTGALAGFALVPGLRIPFLLVGGVAGLIARQLHKRGPASPETVDADGESTAPRPLGPEDMLALEELTLEVGLDLVHMVDDTKSGDLVERIRRLRNQFAQDLGLVLPSVHLRDDLKLGSGEYVLKLRGEEIGRGSVRARQQLAIDPGDAKGVPKGIKTIDPVFGLDAYWIPAGQVLKAQAMGFTVVDVPTVLATHLTELLHLHAHELYGMDQLSRTLERVGDANPPLVEDIIPDPLPRQTVLRVFRNLLREGVSVRDTQSILEALGDYARKSQDADVLTEFVRQRLSRHISRRLTDEQGILHCLTLSREVEDAISKGIQQQSGSISLFLDPGTTRSIVTAIRSQTEAWGGSSELVVLCPALARGPFRRMAEKFVPRVTVVSPAELLPTVRLKTQGTVRLQAS